MQINADERILLKNLCEWDLYFPKIETAGDVMIPKGGVTRIPFSEIQAQVYSGNKMLVGIDGKGGHAKILIDDKNARVVCGFEEESAESKQEVIDTEAIKKLMEIKTLNAFKKKVQETILLESEKLTLVEEAKKLGLNDHEKIKFIETYTGFKFNE